MNPTLDDFLIIIEYDSIVYRGIYKNNQMIFNSMNAPICI